MKLSIVVPCYNEEGNVKAFSDAVYKVFKNKKIKYEIIFVNDGSKDNTIKQLKELIAQEKQNIKVINFSRNFGKEAAMYAGLNEVSGDYVTIIDADLQQRPELILNMLDILEANKEYDSVAAYQEKRKEGKILTFFKDCFYKLINKISTVPFVQGASDFRTFRKSVVDAILNVSEYHRFSKGIFSFVGFNTYYMPYVVEERNSGNSKWSFIKLFNYAIEGIVAFTTSPLRISFFLGFLTLFAFLITLVISIITGITLLKSIIFMLLLIFGLQFLVLGVIGEYLSKTYIQTKNRPVYIVKEIIESNKNRK